MTFSRRFGGLVSHLHQKKILSVYLETRKKFGRWFPCINVLVVVSEYVGRIFGFIGGHHQVVRSSSQLSEVHSVAFSHCLQFHFQKWWNFRYSVSTSYCSHFLSFEQSAQNWEILSEKFWRFRIRDSWSYLMSRSHDLKYYW